jgi:glycosyltransferase involved in cell wall biosynthesis
MGAATKKIAVVAAFPLHALESFGPAFYPQGHYATWLPQLAGAWEAQADFEIHWITGSELVHRASCHPQWNQRFHVYPSSRHGRATSFYRQDRRHIREILRQIKPDLVHAWGTEDVCGFAGVLSQAPCILSMQGILTHLVRHGWHPLRVYFQALLEIFCLRRAAWVTVESDWGRQKIRPFRGKRPVEVIEYGVHPDFFKARWEPNIHKPRFLFLGTICAQKGVQDCLAAFRDPCMSQARLEIFGSGNPRYVQGLQAACTPNVEWRGRQPREVVIRAMEKATGLILPTRADTSPNVVKEARVVGLPVIVSPHGGQVAYVKNGEDGFVVPTKDVNRLVLATHQLSQSPSLALKMGELGRMRYREKFLPLRTAEAFLGLYRKALANHSVKSPHP